MNKKIGIVGGGMLGMMLAYRLSQKKHNVTLFEAADDFGGLASAWDIDGITWDKFYHVILLSDNYLRTILNELGLDKELNWVETKTGFYSNGTLISMSNTLEFLKFPPLNIIDKLRLGFTIFYASRIKNRKALEGKHVADWLIKLSGKNTFEKIWLPLLRSKLGDSYKKTSAAFIWATIQRMYAARRSGLKKEMFGYMNGGYAKILETFGNKLNELGVTLKPNHRTTSIKVNSEKLNITFDNGTSEEFDKVILTIASAFIPDICQQLTYVEKKKLHNINYLGVICASVLLKNPVSQYYVTNITDSGFPFTGVIEMTALVNQKYFEGKNLIYLPKYVKHDDPIFDESDEAIRERFINALIKMHPQITRKEILFTGIARERNVFALSTINYSENLLPIETSMNGLYIINSSHITNGTLNVNETVRLAEETVKKFIK